MPAGNLGAYAKKAGRYANKAYEAVKGNKTAQAVASNSMVKKMRQHKVATAVGGMAVAGGIASGRRRSGLDKPQGRPTGIYGRQM